MLKPGKIVERFVANKNGTNIDVALRFPKPNDLKQLMKFYNKVIRETDFLANFRRVSLEKERKWLKNVLDQMKKKNMVHIVVEVDGKIVGSCGIERETQDTRKHVGKFGIALLQDFTRLGIGTKLAKTALKIAKDIGIEIIQSSYFSKNIASRKLHKKLGFKVVGRLPKSRKRNGKYSDEIIVYKILKR